MTRLLLGLALRLYPSGWLERYGAELEQMLAELAAEQPTAREKFRLAIDLARGGLRERFGRSRTAVRVTAMVCLGAVIAVPVDVASVNSSPAENGLQASSPSSGVRLSASTRLGPGVIVFRLPRGQFPSALQPRTPVQRGAELVELLPSRTVIGVAGAPVNVVLNPDTGHIVSVALIHRSQAR